MASSDGWLYEAFRPRLQQIADELLDSLAAEDVEIGGVTIPSGSKVQIALATASNDPGRLADPDTFDIHRDAGEGLAFGHGIHSCLGARLAKLEGEVFQFCKKAMVMNAAVIG